MPAPYGWTQICLYTISITARNITKSETTRVRMYNVVEAEFSKANGTRKQLHTPVSSGVFDSRNVSTIFVWSVSHFRNADEVGTNDDF